jgi:hypothetical protein
MIVWKMEKQPAYRIDEYLNPKQGVRGVQAHPPVNDQEKKNLDGASGSSSQLRRY